MCPGPKPTPITITISATAAKPNDPTLSDGLATSQPGKANEFKTVVVPTQTIMFRVGGDIAAITAVPEGPGSDIFSTDPLLSNNWTGIIGADLGNNDTREYSICYTMKGDATGTVYTEDPKLQMKK
tara:strand:+ start:2158 stop:2535 length:378 start_codon:yes stop_codon:yes gene_type:complete